MCTTLETGTSSQKITLLQGLSAVDSPDIIARIIDCFDDDDLQVRGEAFSSLMLNENGCISEHLINALNSASRNVRAFASLVLANRRDNTATPHIVRLASDESSLVRSCAVGALGYLGAADAGAKDAMITSLFDGNTDVKKSAAHSVITLRQPLSPDVLENISRAWSDEMQKDPDLCMLFERLAACSK